MGKITDDYLVFRILNVLQSEVSSQCVFNVSYNLSSNILNVEGIWKGMLTFFFLGCGEKHFQFLEDKVMSFSSSTSESLYLPAWGVVTRRGWMRLAAG